MSHRIVVVLGSLALLGLGAAAGCMVVTGSSDGYVEADGGVDAATPTVTSACPPDAAVCVLDECTGTAGCAKELGAGAVCCVGVLGVSPAVAVGGSCEMSSCGLDTVQGCDTDSDCQTGTCTLQSCPFPGAPPLVFQACSVFPGCAIVVSGDGGGGGTGDGGGAGKPEGGADAGPGDAGDASISDAGDAGDADIADAAEGG